MLATDVSRQPGKSPDEQDKKEKLPTDIMAEILKQAKQKLEKQRKTGSDESDDDISSAESSHHGNNSKKIEKIHVETTMSNYSSRSISETSSPTARHKKSIKPESILSTAKKITPNIKGSIEELKLERLESQKQIKALLYEYFEQISVHMKNELERKRQDI